MAVSQCSFIVSPLGGKRLSLSESLTIHSTACSKALIHSKRDVMKHAVEIILTFKGSADQQSVDAKTDFTFLEHDNLFSQIYRTRPEGQTQLIARFQSIFLIRCLFRLVKCKSTSLCTNQHGTLLSLLTYLIFSTHTWSVKREEHNLTKKENT